MSQPIKELIKDICTPTGNLEVDIQRAKDYSNLVGMDSANSKILEVMTTQGPDAAFKAMVSEFTNNEENFDYAAMRMRYG